MAGKKKAKKKTKQAKGQIPIEVLEERLKKLRGLVRRRGGSVS